MKHARLEAPLLMDQVERHNQMELGDRAASVLLRMPRVGYLLDGNAAKITSAALIMLITTLVPRPGHARQLI